MPSPVLDGLVQRGELTTAQAEEAIAYAAANGQSELVAAVRLRFIDRATALAAAAATADVEVGVDLAAERADPDAINLLTAAQARRWHVVPLKFIGDALQVAGTAETAANPTVKDDLARILGGRPFRWVIADERALEAKLNAEYRAEAELSSISERAASGDDSGELARRFVNLVLNQAIIDRASDIHIEPGEREVTVRFRIDGVLIDKPVAAQSLQSAVINQLKILAGIDIAESRRPQDGRLSVDANGRRLDMRVATLPTVWGEKVVLRILDNSTTHRSLADFSFLPDNERRFRSSFTKPNGLILVTGPTGSGKSTTLYATLNELNDPAVNIITVEDPVEYRLARINQVQVNVKAGMTFAAALRSILRSDPDIILLGEIRDLETARIAVEAAQTGHLVLSTLHTNNAPESATRLTEMGIEPFLVASVLECVVAQRLVRRLCDACKQPFTPSQAELDQIGFTVPAEYGPPKFFTARGCNKCTGTGYRGRFAVQEVMTRNPELERAIAEKRMSEEVAQHAITGGLVPLRQDGWIKVAQGLTTFNEILRVIN